MSPASRREGEGGCAASVTRRRGHRDEAVEGEEGDTIPDLLLKHPDETFATYETDETCVYRHATYATSRSTFTTPR